jgi:hypothetical protein
LARIKERWGVSIKALGGRFRSLGVIDTDHARSLYKQISARGWNKIEPVEVGNESGVWLHKALDKWNRADSNAMERAASSSGLSVTYFERWTSWGPTGDAPAGELVSVDLAKPKRRASDETERGSVTLLGIRTRGPREP